MIRAGLVALCLAAGIALQVFLYVSFVQREVVWNYALHGDPTWYMMLCYQIFEALIARDWGTIGRFAAHSPWGVPLFVEAALTQLIFGSGRLGVVAINLVYFLLAELATFFFFRRVARSSLGGLLAVLLLLAMQTPFRGDGAGLNIVDFHFDLVLFYLLLGILYLVGRSETFAHRGWAIAVGALAALAVATRLVSVFLLVGIFGALFLWLAWRLWRGMSDRVLARIRLVNLAIAGLVFAVMAALPIWVARKALYAHYFRFVFDRKFSEDRAGLYSMGNSKLTEAWQLIYRMLAFDFAWPFALALVLFLAVASMGRASASASAAPGGEREAQRTFVGFLSLTIVVSYVIHLMFPIQSDHLTRMTAAPIYVLIAFLGVRPAAAALDHSRTHWRGAAAVASIGLAVIAGYVQLAFYTGKGRYADRRAELEKVADLYGDISKIVHARDMRAIAMSVDSVSTYELGGMTSYISYEYEHHGRLLRAAAKLGNRLDEPISREDALAAIDLSEFVLLRPGPYNSGGYWPMMKSVSGFHDAIVERVRRNFCLISSHTIEGQYKELYARPQAWRVVASAQRNRRSGPEGLLGAGHVTWTAPWRAGAEQWVEFAAPVPVTITSLGLQVVKKTLQQGPRDFRLEAIDDAGTSTLLSVRDNSFASSTRQTWDVQGAAPARRYRLTITANNGDPGWVSIQRMWVGLDNAPCEFGHPYR